VAGRAPVGTGGRCERAGEGMTPAMMTAAAATRRGGRNLTNRSPGRAGAVAGIMSPEEPLGELRQTFVTLAFRPRTNAIDERPQLFLAPVVSGRTLGATGVAGSRSLEERFGRGFVVCGIGAVGKCVAFPRIAPGAGVFFHERARHFSPLDESVAMSQLSRRYHESCRSISANRHLGGWMSQES